VATYGWTNLDSNINNDVPGYVHSVAQTVDYDHSFLDLYYEVEYWWTNLDSNFNNDVLS
jgi:hypothetical protein